MIEVINLTKKYENCVALNDINFEVDNGEFIVVTGRSGSGKSTLLKCMCGLLLPSSGEVLIDGKNIYQMTESEKCCFRNQKIGFIFQSYALEPKYTAFENIELPMLIKGDSTAKRKSRVREVAAFVGISSLLNKRTEILSGGEQQRVGVARALVNKPQIIFADEPCGNLDKQNSEAVINLLYSVKNSGTTVVLVTHQPQDVTKPDKVIELLDGRIV